jgi:hypothetical protein
MIAALSDRFADEIIKEHNDEISNEHNEESV